MISQSFTLNTELDEHSKALLEKCQEVLSQGLDMVLLVIPMRPKSKYGRRVRLAGKGSPIADVVSETEKGIVVYASAMDVAVWILALHGAEEVL